ncbi:hypothetical protein PO909_031447, partial [Leuciscus waleckii]
QKALGDIQRKFQQRIQEREKELQELKEAVKTHRRSAQAAVEDSERIFTELIRSIERSRSEVTRMIRDQEKAQVSRAEGLLKRLEQEIDDLRRREAELKQLLHTDDHIHFLQSFQSLSVPPASTDSINVSSLLSYDDIGKSVSMLKEKLEDFCKEKYIWSFGFISDIHLLPPLNPGPEMTSCNIPVNSPWIQTLHINTSIFQKATEWLLLLGLTSCTLFIRTDFMIFLRCCVERVCVDAVTGRWSGVGRLGWEYQCHIRASAGREMVTIVSLDLMISPGDCPALTPGVHSDTIRKWLNSL